MVLTVSFVLAPETGLVASVAGATRKRCHQISAPGYQAHTTSPSALACVRRMQADASTASPPNVRDDRETPLCIEHGMSRILPVILAVDQYARLRRINTTGKSGALLDKLSSDEQLLRRPCPGRGAANAFTRVFDVPWRCAAEPGPTRAGKLNAGSWTPDQQRTMPLRGALRSSRETKPPSMRESPLDTPAPHFVNRTLLAAMVAGRIAQRESVPFTRERSKVRSLVRPPCSPFGGPYGKACVPTSDRCPLKTKEQHQVP
jgi:hypothetical protein